MKPLPCMANPVLVHTYTCEATQGQYVGRAGGLQSHYTPDTHTCTLYGCGRKINMGSCMSSLGKLSETDSVNLYVVDNIVYIHGPCDTVHP